MSGTAYSPREGKPPGRFTVSEETLIKTEEALKNAKNDAERAQINRNLLLEAALGSKPQGCVASWQNSFGMEISKAYNFNPDEIAAKAEKEGESPYIALGKWATKARQAQRDNPNLPNLYLGKSNMRSALVAVSAAMMRNKTSWESEPKGVRKEPARTNVKNSKEDQEKFKERLQSIRTQTGHTGWLTAKSTEETWLPETVIRSTYAGRLLGRLLKNNQGLAGKSPRDLLKEFPIDRIEPEETISHTLPEGEIRQIPPRKLEEIWEEGVTLQEALNTLDPKIWRAALRNPKTKIATLEACSNHLRKNGRSTSLFLMRIGLPTRNLAIEMAATLDSIHNPKDDTLQRFQSRLDACIKEIVANPKPKELEKIKAYEEKLRDSGYQELLGCHEKHMNKLSVSEKGLYI